MTPSTLLLLAPSLGFGGGIERVSAAVEAAWDGSVVRVDLYRRGSVSIPEGHRLTKAGFAVRAVAASLRTQPDVVMALHVGLLPVARAAARPTRATTAVICHGTEVWGPTRKRRERALRRSDCPMAVSSFTAREVAGRADLPLERISVLPLPASSLDDGLPTDPPSTDAGRRQFITVSRLSKNTRYKGYFDIARALPTVLECVPDARWIVVGVGDDLDALQEECRRRSISHAVEFRGSLTDAQLSAAYRQASFLALPSTANPDAMPPTGEGLGVVYLEAATFGLPSIASTGGGGALDFVEDGLTGLTVDPSNPVALGDSIVRLLSDDALRVRLGEAAQSRVRDRHLPSHFRAALADAIRAR